MSITRSDRDALMRVLRMRAQVDKTDAERVAKERLAAFEEQLATIHSSREPMWKDLAAQASKAVREADAELARRCAELGIPEEFRPSINYSRAGRGENADKVRRAELRKVAVTRIDAKKAAALAFIERQHAELATQVVAGSLESGEAKTFLDALPSMDKLLGPVALADVEADTPLDAKRIARVDRYGERVADKYPDLQ